MQVILLDEAHARVDTTMHDIAARVAGASAFPGNLFPGEAFAQLFSSANLVLWESPSTFIQVDDGSGYPVARTPNLGATNIPPNPSLHGNKAAFRLIELDEREFLVEDRIFQSGNAIAIVHVAEPLDTLQRTLAQARQAILLILLAAAAALVVLSIVLASQISGPIAALSRAMREASSERLDVRLPPSNRSDEIGELTASFNDLLARLQEAFARERQFISDASHELKTPLTSINANAQLLLRWGDRDETVRKESLETIVNESASLAGMVNGMLTLAKADRGDAIEKEPVSLAQLASEATRGAAQRAAEKHLALAFDHGAQTPLVVGNEALLRQAIGNLIDNAIKFTPAGGVYVRIGTEADKAWVEVADTGPGIPEEELGSVFERFYRADKARSRDVPGTGLGLAIVRSIARVHDGSVTAGRAPEGGALFRITLPRLRDTLIESS